MDGDAALLCIGDDVSAGLVRHLEEVSKPKPSKKKRKRASADVFPEDAGAANAAG